VWFLRNIEFSKSSELGISRLKFYFADGDGNGCAVDDLLETNWEFMKLVGC
jgi:hypothetical protein